MLTSVADKYNDSTRKYDQTVSLNGQIVSRLSTGKSLTAYQIPGLANT